MSTENEPRLIYAAGQTNYVGPTSFFSCLWKNLTSGVNKRLPYLDGHWFP